MVSLGMVSLGMVSLGMVSLGMVSLGMVSLGMVSLGMVSLGIVSLGMVSFWMVSLGIVSMGTSGSIFSSLPLYQSMYFSSTVLYTLSTLKGNSKVDQLFSLLFPVNPFSNVRV